METKSIRFSDGIKAMTFEECYKQFSAFRKQFVIKYHMIPDIEQEVDLAFWKAFKYYDVDKGYCFSTIAHYQIKNHLWHIIRDTKLQKRKPLPTVSLSEVFYNNGDDKYIFVEESITSLDNVEDKAITKIAYENAYNRLNDKQKLRINTLIQSCNQQQAAELTGISQIQMSRMKNLFRKYFQEELTL